MARYAVEHIWEGKQEYFLIRDHQSWQMVLLPSKYLTHLIRANRSPNTVGRRAKSIRFYLEYLDEKEMELSQVAELEFQEQYEHCLLYTSNSREQFFEWNLTGFKRSNHFGVCVVCSIASSQISRKGIPCLLYTSGKNGLYAERSADRHPRGNAAGGLL